MQKHEKMKFIDQCLDDEIINTVEKMVNLHISKNYKEVRNIILGYNSKEGKWESRYGKNLEKKLLVTERPENIFPDNFSKKGMVFFEDDIYSNVRFHTDESVKRILEILFTISDKVIEYRYVIDIIISEWNLKNTRHISPSRTDIDTDICGNLYFHQIEVRENAWRELKSIGRLKGLNIKDCFKQAVIDFLEDRSKMLR